MNDSIIKLKIQARHFKSAISYSKDCPLKHAILEKTNSKDIFVGAYTVFITDTNYKIESELNSKIYAGFTNNVMLDLININDTYYSNVTNIIKKIAINKKKVGTINITLTKIE